MKDKNMIEGTEINLKNLYAPSDFTILDTKTVFQNLIEAINGELSLKYDVPVNDCPNASVKISIVDDPTIDEEMYVKVRSVFEKIGWAKVTWEKKIKGVPCSCGEMGVSIVEFTFYFHSDYESGYIK